MGNTAKRRVPFQAHTDEAALARSPSDVAIGSLAATPGTTSRRLRKKSGAKHRRNDQGVIANEPRRR